MLWSSVEHSTILDTDLLYIAGTLFYFLKKYRVERALARPQPTSPSQNLGVDAPTSIYVNTVEQSLQKF